MNLTTANQLTILRMMLIPAFVILLLYEYRGWALITFFAASLTDLLDGLIARATGQKTTLGAWLDQNLGFKVIFAPPGIILALLFVTFPFVVRTVQPVLLSLDRAQEEAAATLGAGAWTTFRRVVLPALAPALISGTLLSFARAIGEFGAIVIVAGNIPLRSQTAAVYVFGEIESENQRGASAMSVVMSLSSRAFFTVATRRAARPSAYMSEPTFCGLLIAGSSTVRSRTSAAYPAKHSRSPMVPPFVGSSS